MCGIIGYIGQNQASPILLAGLKRMEYRGYDSSGVALINGRKLKVFKKEGKLRALQEELEKYQPDSFIGLGHIRWATHGAPTDLNAHPHLDCQKKIAIVHNGIIENMGELKEGLKSAGHQ